MMTIKQHRWSKWLIPIGLIVASVPVGMFMARLFPETKSIGNIALFGGIVTAMLASFSHQFLPVQCPRCNVKLEYFPATHGKMFRYTCKKCGFKGI